MVKSWIYVLLSTTYLTIFAMITHFLGLGKWPTSIPKTHRNSWAWCLMFRIPAPRRQKTKGSLGFTAWTMQPNWWAPGTQKTHLTGGGQYFWRQHLRWFSTFHMYAHMHTQPHMYSHRNEVFTSMAYFSILSHVRPCRELWQKAISPKHMLPNKRELSNSDWWRNQTRNHKTTYLWLHPKQTLAKNTRILFKRESVCAGRQMCKALAEKQCFEGSREQRYQYSHKIHAFLWTTT